jgi:hypothetical protein
LCIVTIPSSSNRNIALQAFQFLKFSYDDRSYKERDRETLLLGGHSILGNLSRTSAQPQLLIAERCIQHRVPRIYRSIVLGVSHGEHHDFDVTTMESWE